LLRTIYDSAGFGNKRECVLDYDVDDMCEAPDATIFGLKFDRGVMSLHKPLKLVEESIITGRVVKSPVTNLSASYKKH
jgi:hypothetical protein